MKTKKKANQVKRYYSVTFEDNNETIINPNGCITDATPIILNEYEGKKGQEVMVAQYDLTKAKMNNYRINGDTPLTQEKPLTKAELVKLYEEFRARKWNGFQDRLNGYYAKELDILIDELMIFDFVRDVLVPWGWEKRMIKRLPGKIKGDDLLEVLNKVKAGRPKFTEPTLNEFMESLGEKGESHKGGAVVSYLNYYRLSEAERAGLLTETN